MRYYQKHHPHNTKMLSLRKMQLQATIGYHSYLLPRYYLQNKQKVSTEDVEKWECLCSAGKFQNNRATRENNAEVPQSGDRSNSMGTNRRFPRVWGGS